MIMKNTSGFAIYGIRYTWNQQQRSHHSPDERVAYCEGHHFNVRNLLQRYDWRFTYDHVMLIYGQAVDEQGKPYYMVKNSWGPQGDYNGIWYMSRDYMMLNTTYLFLNRNALPKDLRKKHRK